jgi:hypothetical protein
MECVHLAPNAQVSLYPWKDTLEKIPLAVRHIRTFYGLIARRLPRVNLWLPPPSRSPPSSSPGLSRLVPGIHVDGRNKSEQVWP